MSSRTSRNDDTYCLFVYLRALWRSCTTLGRPLWPLELWRACEVFKKTNFPVVFGQVYRQRSPGKLVRCFIACFMHTTLDVIGRCEIYYSETRFVVNSFTPCPMQIKTNHTTRQTHIFQTIVVRLSNHIITARKILSQLAPLSKRANRPQSLNACLLNSP